METPEKRRLQELGGSLFVSLPQKWIKNFHLGKGSDILVYLDEKGNLFLSPTKQQEKEKKSAVLEFGDFFYRELIREYLDGTDMVIIKNQEGFSKQQRDYVVHAVQNLMNCEIIEEDLKKIVIQNFRINETPLPALINRIYFLTKTMLADLAQEKADKRLVESIIDRDKQVGKFYFHIIRTIKTLLDGYMIGDLSLADLMTLRMAIERIEQIGDEIKAVAQEMLHGKKYQKDMLVFLLDTYDKSFSAFAQKDVLSAREFWKNEAAHRKQLGENIHLIRLYDHIKDLADLVI